MDEIHALKSGAQGIPNDGERNLVSLFERALRAMSRLSDSYPLMRKPPHCVCF